MHSAIALLVGVFIGVAVSVAMGYVWFGSRMATRNPAPSSPGEPPSGTPGFSVPHVHRIVNAVPGALILVDTRSARPIVTSDEAYRLRLVDGDRLLVPQLVAMVGDVGRGATTRTEELSVRRASPAGKSELRIQVVAIDDLNCLVLADDISTARRVDEVRRDFVANVSHELKTPVGALSLLSEAIFTAADDPNEVRHFAERMRIESARLARLVGDLVDLSRLQGEDPMVHAAPVDVDSVIVEAVDAVRTTAAARDIDVFIGGETGLQVSGVEGQLVTAVRNLVTNAVAYSPDHTRVAVACRSHDGAVDITVTDQGIGIPASELDRIFERFYRIDQARSRQTGGTGLGLAIVKHVCQNHGGSVAVWSVEGEGSTFTLTLPLIVPPAEVDTSTRQEVRPPKPAARAKRTAVKPGRKS